MNSRQPIKLAREKLLFQYTNALERGDFATVEAILNAAQQDAELERMLAEINMALHQELPSSKSFNRRFNQKESDMDMLLNTPIYPKAANAPKRFPYALAAAILAVVLIGGLLATAQFGFGRNGDTLGSGALQRESATAVASATPSPLNPIVVTGTPTILPNPNSSTATVLCEAQLIGSSPVELMSRPNAVVVGSMAAGEAVQILDMVYSSDQGVDSIDPGIILGPSDLGNLTLWYFVRLPQADIPLQGWVSSYQITLLTDCPNEPFMGGTPVVSGSMPTILPPTATALAATAQAYFNDLGTPQNDSDGDGLSDSDEANYGTNPNAWDTDDDGLSDGSEIERGTDPLNLDTDMDGVVDSQDQFPTDPSQAVVTAVATVPAATPTASWTPMPAVCNPNNPVRFSLIGAKGRVIGEGHTGVNLREWAGFTAPLIRLLDVGTEFSLTSATITCVDNTNWYQVTIDGVGAGWIPETMWVIEDGAASSVYVIEPTQ